jgi:hypothetical protein
MGGILHLKSTAGCQISSLIFGFRGDPIHIPCKIAEGLKVLSHLGKWERTLPSFGKFSWSIQRAPPLNPNIKVDI